MRTKNLCSTQKSNYAQIQPFKRSVSELNIQKNKLKMFLCKGGSTLVTFGRTETP